MAVKHKQCKFYGYRSCVHRNDPVMERATADIPEYHGGNFMSFPDPPSDEEIDEICDHWEKFTSINGKFQM